MNEVSFIGKSLLLTHKKERVLVIGDLHLGYEAALRGSGVFIPAQLIEQTVKDLQAILKQTGKVDKIVLLGDVKHVFGFVLRDERTEVMRVFDLLERFGARVVIVKGNHDTILEPLVTRDSLTLVDYFIWNSVIFVHGDKDLREMHDKMINTWIMGHFHPALTLKEGAKQETYKCFLRGKYEKKTVYLVPSFFSANEGSSPEDFIHESEWKFNLGSFEVFIVGDVLKVYPFGTLRKLQKDSLV